MAAKQLLFGEAARARILKGIGTLAEAVRITLGPRARTVVLESAFGPPKIVNSGVIVAKEIELADPFENLGAQMAREVAAKTSEVAGDGTTTATLLAAAIVTEGMKHVVAGVDPMDLKRGIDLAVEAVVAKLKALARPCASRAEIAHVAAISANNDPAIGEMVAEAMQKAGREGANADQDAGIRIVRRALEEPLRQLAANAGRDPSVVLARVAEGEGSFGFNAATGEFGDLAAMGVLDPCKVTRTGLQNAASIAGLVLTTDVLVARIAERKQAAAGADEEV